ncbi:putative T7SS-secreted protein [Micromonospora sp. NPDC003197]
MARPYDWWVLDLDRDPTPGAPERLDVMGDRFLDFADVAHRAYRSVQSLQGDGAVLTWVGLSGDAFREQFGELPEQLRKLHTSHQMAGDALHVYAPKLTTAQAQADRALADGRAAREQLSSLNSQLAIAESDFAAISRQADELRDLPSETNRPDPEQVRQALRDAEVAGQRLTTVRGQAASAEQALQAAKILADQARQMRDAAAQTCEREIREASDVGIQPRSFWQKLGDAFKAIWDVICEIAKWVALVAGVIALVIGGPLAWVALAAGAVLLVKAIVDFAQGKGEILDLVFGVLGIIPGVRGLTSLSKLQSLYKAGGLKEIGKAALGSMKNLATELAAVVKNVGAGTVTVVKNLGGSLDNIVPKISFGGRGGRNSQAIVNYGGWGDDVSDAAKMVDTKNIESHPVVAKLRTREGGKWVTKDQVIGVSFPGKEGDLPRQLKWGEKKSSNNTSYFRVGDTRPINAPWREGRGSPEPIFVIAHSDQTRVGLTAVDIGKISVDGSTFAKILGDSNAFQQARSANPDGPIVLLACNFARSDDVVNEVAKPFSDTLRNILNNNDLKIFGATEKVDVTDDGKWPVHKGGEFKSL